MALCTHCGDTVTFRYINGRCIPLHSTGSCGNSSGGTFTDFTKDHHAPQSACYLTSCPICRAAVFFVRHNGGSVWLDSPLGPPWPKHGCFIDEQPNPRHPLGSAEHVSTSESKAAHGDSAGVIRYSRVMPEHASTECILETGSSGAYFLNVKNNAGYLLGRLCEINKADNTISPAYAPDLKYSISELKKTRMPHTTFCHICRAEVSLKNLKKHLTKTHNIQ